MGQKFSKLLHEPLPWKADGVFKSSHTLYHDEQPIAYFRQESGVFKQDASIYWADAEDPLFILRPKGVFKQHIEVESNDLDFEAAKIKPHGWANGLHIHFLNGNDYEWKAVDTWGHKWMLHSSVGTKIAKLEVSTWGTSGTITVVSDEPNPAELNLLIFAGWAQYIFNLQAAAAA